MDERLTQEPIIEAKLQELVHQAEQVYHEHFNTDCWLGRCIFLSFYCSVNTCDFCFRSVADKKTQDPEKSMRSLGSILTEALLIKAFDWRIEFLTGGYGITNPQVTKRYVKLVKAILQEPIWLNLGVLHTGQLEELRDDVGGVVASLETLSPTLHKKTCPDKPIEPYTRMLRTAQKLGYKRSITLVIGLGETQDDWHYVKTYIDQNPLERITIYALRPVLGTPYTKGPTSAQVAWWIAMVRITYPTIEIIAGSAEYRLPEIGLFLRAGANAITKVPATKMFNTPAAKLLEEQVRKAGRKWVSCLQDDNPEQRTNFEEQISNLDLTPQEKEEVKRTLSSYLRMMKNNKEKKSLLIKGE